MTARKCIALDGIGVFRVRDSHQFEMHRLEHNRCTGTDQGQIESGSGQLSGVSWLVGYVAAVFLVCSSDQMVDRDL
jgi:hypothetical protein